MFCGQRQAFTDAYYYLAVYRGVLVSIEQKREVAEALPRSFNFAKLLLWYHDRYRKRCSPPRRDVHAPWPSPAGTYRKWLENGYAKLAPEYQCSLLSIWDRNRLEKSENPLVALHRFLTEREPEAKAGDDDGQLSLW